MKRFLFAPLVALLVLGLASAALAVAPTVIDPAADGQSAWTYQDLHDAAAKYEGGYASFDDTLTPGGMYTADIGDTAAGETDTTGPHGGYSTTTNKCKVCHAVHRAEGAYYLLRADSQDDACTYCHVDSAHSSRVVYDLNPDGIYTTNGHTIGAQTEIPDSTIRQEAEAVILSTTDASGNPVVETIHVRSYDVEKNKMYRFARHHGQSEVSFNPTPPFTGGVTGSARGGYQKIGPLALRCMSCHQPHNAVGEVWRPRAFVAETWTAANYSSRVNGPFLTAGYKLLRRSPSGSTTGMPYAPGASDPLIYYGANQVIKAIEDTALPGVNFSRDVSADFQYTENGVTRSAPLWIAQDIHAPASGAGVYRYPNVVNNMALSWWCADCHNLNIGGWEPLTDPELGFKAHTERTHPAPYYGSYTGPAQCYSCHRNDLPPQMGLTDAANPLGGATPAAIYAGRESCTQCHFGTGDYFRTRVNPATMLESDFPHSGSANDIKLLGAYSVVDSDTTNGTWEPQYVGTSIDETSIDAVCTRCHPGIGVNH